MRVWAQAALALLRGQTWVELAQGCLLELDPLAQAANDSDYFLAL